LDFEVKSSRESEVLDFEVENFRRIGSITQVSAQLLVMIGPILGKQTVNTPVFSFGVLPKLKDGALTASFMLRNHEFSSHPAFIAGVKVAGTMRQVDFQNLHGEIVKTCTVKMLQLAW